MSMKKYLLVIQFFFFLSLPFSLTSQEIFEFDEFIKIVKSHHPVIQQCNIILKSAENKLSNAKGAFDPIFSSSINRKELDDKTYYNLMNGNLKIPIWSGIELNSGTYKNSGSFINPEDYIQSEHLWYTGITIPIGKNLLIDSRVAEIKKAKELISLSLEDIRLIKNNLIYDAIKKYFNWVEKYNDFKIYEEFVDLSYNRFLAVKQQFIYGGLASIDSLEAYVVYQSRLYNKSQYEKEYINETIQLSNFLWLENNVPLEISTQLNPPSYTVMLNHPDLHIDTNQNTINSMIENHPAILALNNKINIQHINKKLSKENLKPNLNMNYNFLSSNADINQLNFNNYKLGLDFSYSLFLRKERSELNLAKLKLRDLEYEITLKKLSILNATKQYINEFIFTENQADILEDITRNYTNLLNGEKLKFDAGESSVFLINSRESKLIESKLTLVQLKVKAIVFDYGIDWSLGLLD